MRIEIDIGIGARIGIDMNTYIDIDIATNTQR